MNDGGSSLTRTSGRTLPLALGLAALAGAGIAVALWTTRETRGPQPAPLGARPASASAASDASRAGVDEPNGSAEPPIAPVASITPAAAAPVAPPGSGSVEVRLSGTGEPVPGVALLFEREPFGPTSPTHRATTDSAGRIALEGLPVGRWHARADDDFLHVEPRRAFVDVLPVPDPWPTVMSVHRGALVTGRVVDPRGQPVAEAVVAVRTAGRRPTSLDFDDAADLPARSAALDAVRSTSDRDGRFALRAAPASPNSELRVDHSGFAPHAAPLGVLEAGATVAVPPVVLGPGGTLRVAVTENERPVAGAAIHVVETIEETASLGTSGPDGIAVVPRLRAGTYEIAVIAGAFRPQWRNHLAIEGEKTTEVAVRLFPGESLVGIAVDADARPVAGAVVEAQRSVVWEKATTAADGRFHLSGLAAGETRVRVAAAGFASERLTVAVGGGAGVLRLTLRREASVAGDVVGPDGRPVTRYRLVVESRSDDSFGESKSPRQTIDVADPDGRFRVAGLLPGPYRLKADAAGRGLGSGESADVVVEDGGAVEGVRIVVGATIRVRARVRDESTGELVAGARAEWTDDTADGDWRRPRGLATQSGADGILDLELPSGATNLRVAREEYLESIVGAPLALPVAGSAVEIDVALSRGGGVAGTVREASGAPATASRVELRGDEGRTRETAVDASGGYQISGLAPGDYVVGVRPDGEIWNYDEYATIAIVAGETVRVDFGPGARRGSRVFGRVLSGGETVADISVTLGPADRPFVRLVARSGSDGAFDFPCVPAGDFLLATRWHGSEISREVTVDGVEPVRADLVLPTGSLGVTVLDAGSGAAVAGVSVHVDTIVRESVSGRTDGNGRAEFEGLSVGEATIRAGGSGRPVGGGGRSADYASRSVVTTVPESGAGHAEIRLNAGTVLEGRVTGPDGQPIPYPAVLLRGIAATGADDYAVPSSGDYRMGTEGRYRIERLNPGTYAAVVRARDAATTFVPGVRVDAGASRADFALPRAGEAIVRVLDPEGRPVPHVPVRCEIALPGVGAIVLEQTVTDRDGRSPPPRLAPGEYAFVAEISSESLDALVGESSPREGDRRATGTVVAGETIVITLVLE